MVLSELVIQLSANTAKLSKDFDQAKSMASKLVSEFQSIMGGLGISLAGVGAGGVAGELFGLADAAAKVGAEIYKMKEISGLSAEALSGLRVASKEAGEDFDTMARTLALAGKNIISGLINPGATAGQMLTALFGKAGVESLKLEPVSQRLADVAKKVFSLTDEQERDFAASTLFGKGWQSNLETLQAVAREGLDPLTEKARALGQLITGEQAEATRNFGRAWADIKLMIDGAALSIGEHLIPILIALTGHVGAMQKMSDQLDAMQKNAGVLKTDVIFGEDDSSKLDLGGLKIPKVMDAPKSLTDLLTKVPKVKSTSFSDAGASDLDAVAKMLEALGREKAEFGMTTEAVKLFEMELKGATEADLDFAKRTLDGITTKQAARKATDDLQKSTDDYQRTLEDVALQAYKDVETAGQQMDDQVQMLSASFKAGYLDVDTYRKAVQQLQDAIDDQKLKKDLEDMPEHLKGIDAATKNMSRDLAQAFTGIVTGSESVGQAFARIIEQMIEMIAQAEIMKGLKGLMGGDSVSSTGGGIFGSIIGALFGGGKAGGGPVAGGTSYLVGEQGPEIFTPGASGSIMPNGAGGTVINIDARGADGGVEYRVARALAAMQRNTAKMAQLQIADAAARG